MSSGVLSTICKPDNRHDQSFSASQQHNFTLEHNQRAKPMFRGGGYSITRSLSLSGFGLSTSDFLPVACQIGSLQALDDSINQLSSIPNKFITSCGGINGLKLLNFNKNRLVGSLPTFLGFVGLQFLDFSDNRLNGEIGLELDELVSLKSLNLAHNYFDGFIPTNLGKSKALEQLELSVNNFHGEIPEQISEFGNLTLIDLSDNQLSGSIPVRIGELSKVEVLILSANNLNGGIPANLSNIATLSCFAANQNNFSGQIPGRLTNYLKILDLSYNKFIWVDSTRPFVTVEVARLWICLFS